MAQLAIAWALQNRNIASAIIGASRPDQVASNVKAAGVTIEAEILTRIKRRHRFTCRAGSYIGQVPETREA